MSGLALRQPMVKDLDAMLEVWRVKITDAIVAADAATAEVSRRVHRGQSASESTLQSHCLAPVGPAASRSRHRLAP